MCVELSGIGSRDMCVSVCVCVVWRGDVVVTVVSGWLYECVAVSGRGVLRIKEVDGVWGTVGYQFRLCGFAFENCQGDSQPPG